MRGVRLLSNELDRLCAQLRDACHILVALDYDGTLAPIAQTPQEARISPECGEVLSRLTDSDRTSLAIISGRSLEDLRRRVPAQAICVGNHGLEIEGPGVSFLYEGARRLRPVIEQACWDLDAAFEGVRGVLVERKGLGATVHYRQAPPDLACWIDATAHSVARPYLSKLRVTHAIKALEIRPKVDWNKGSALRLLLGRMHAIRPELVCAGDDVGDETMFDVVPGAISIRVGPTRNTRARYCARGPSQLLKFLEMLSLDPPVPLPQPLQAFGGRV